MAKKTFENIISNLLGEPTSNLCHAFYDQYVEANVRIRSKLGMKELIIRRQLGKCCNWCADLAGIYSPENAPADIYRRHDNCKCMVTYKDENGYTDAWSKKEFQTQWGARKAKEQELVLKKKDIEKRLLKAMELSETKGVNWPREGVKVSRKEFKEIRAYANSKGIEIYGIKDSMINKDLAKDVIDKTEEIINKYNLADKLDRKFTIDFSRTLNSSGDLAVSYADSNYIVYYNKEAYRNLDALKKEYEDSEKIGYFVKGTNYKSVPYHEMGHIIGDVYEINSLEIAKKILKIEDDVALLKEIEKILSEYASTSVTGEEIIAECFSAVFSGVNNEFALKFVEECDKIIFKEVIA